MLAIQGYLMFSIIEYSVPSPLPLLHREHSVIRLNYKFISLD